MYGRKANCRVRLAHLNVLVLGGHEIHLPWSEVRIVGMCIVPSVYARHRWPELPGQLQLPSVYGVITLRRLRTRAIRRQLSGGTFCQFYSFPRALNATNLALGSAAGTLLTCGVAYVWIHFAFVSGLQIQSDQRELIIQHFQMVLVWAFIIGCIALPLGLLSVHRLIGRWPHIRGLWARSGGAELYYEDGRVVTRTLDEMLRESNGRRMVRLTVGTGDAPTVTEYQLLKRAIGWRRSRPISYRTRVQTMRGPLFAAIALVMILVMIGALSGLNSPSQRTVPMPLIMFGYTALMGAIFTCAMLKDVGFHRVGLRLRQIFFIA